MDELQGTIVRPLGEDQFRAWGKDVFRARVLEVLREGPRTNKEIQEASGLDVYQIGNVLTRLKKRGCVEAVASEQHSAYSGPKNVWALIEEPTARRTRKGTQ